VIAAAKKASAHEFIESLEDFKGRTGYAAHLGERGVKLSGGQRQRIALARAILKDAPILVLDEATSALDSEIEAEIQTTDGQIAEQGSHNSLLAQNGLYHSFWTRQSGGFLGVDAAE